MKITAITKYKHGEIYALLKKLGWTQAELARRAGVQPSEVGKIMNLGKRPSQKNADAIQRAFGEAGEYLDVLSTWPETFLGLKKGAVAECTKDVDIEAIAISWEASLLPDPRGCSQRKGLKELMEREMDRLTLIERQTIEQVFFKGLTHRAAAKKLDRTAQSVGLVVDKVLRKFRQPSVLKRLEAVIDV